MILIEKTQIMGLEPTIRGMRNPMNSWAKSDSKFGFGNVLCADCGYTTKNPCGQDCVDIGPNDIDLMLRLAKAGSVDGKFRRMIAVYVDITAPLYWWKEFDTYKIGTVANSCSTMHKIHAKEFTLEDFSHDHLIDYELLACNEVQGIVLRDYPHVHCGGMQMLHLMVNVLNFYRQRFLDTKDKLYWWQMIQLLPSSYNQKRTVMLNYEVLANIYQHRRNHKLDEWREICRWIESLPYSEIITCNTVEKDKSNALASAIAKLKAEQWSEEEIANLLLGQTKKEQVKLFADGGDTTPVHGGAVDIPAIMADGTKNY